MFVLMTVWVSIGMSLWPSFVTPSCELFMTQTVVLLPTCRIRLGEVFKCENTLWRCVTKLKWLALARVCSLFVSRLCSVSTFSCILLSLVC